MNEDKVKRLAKEFGCQDIFALHPEYKLLVEDFDLHYCFEMTRQERDPERPKTDYETLVRRWLNRVSEYKDIGYNTLELLLMKRKEMLEEISREE